VRYKYEDEAQRAVDKLDGEWRKTLLGFGVRFGTRRCDLSYCSVQGGEWMGGISWCSLPSTAPMLKGCKIYPLILLLSL
jgi:hypothetical protein